MRDLTKAVTSYTWALSVFGVQQAFGLLGLGGSGAWNRNAKALDHVTEATSNELGETMKAVFRAGDTVQRGMIDLFLAPVALVTSPCNGRAGESKPAGDNHQKSNGRQGGWVDAAARAAKAGINAMRDAVDPGSGGLTEVSPASATQTGSAPPSSDPSLGWGPMPR